MCLQSVLLRSIPKAVLAAALVVCASYSVSASSIMGIVYDNNNNPLGDVDVELLSEYYRPIDRARTTENGRYEFGGLSDGRFYVRVLPFRYDLKDETQLVEISTMTAIPGQIGSGIFSADFYLVPRKGSLQDTELGVVFAQEVPKEAQNAYESAVKSLSQKKADEGITGLRSALRLYPDYYMALHRLGKELFIKQQYEEAAPLLIKATEVNPKSATSFYYLGYSLQKLGYPKAAVVALNEAYLLAPASYQVLYVLGTAEVEEGMLKEAEKHLLEAKKLTKSPDIHWALAKLYGEKLKRFKEAADELESYLKAGKFNDKHTSEIKKLITNFRERAKSAS